MTCSVSKQLRPRWPKWLAALSLLLAGPLTTSTAAAETAPVPESVPLPKGLSCFENIGLRSTWVVQLTQAQKGTAPSQLRGTFLEKPDQGPTRSHAFTAQLTAQPPGTGLLLLVSFAKDQTPTVLATGADPAAPQTWRIVRDKQPPAGAYLHGKVSVKLVPQKPQLTMTVRDQGLKKGDAPNANSATYTVTFDLCSARTLERLKAKPQ